MGGYVGHADLWAGGGSPGFNSALTLHWDGNTPLFITDASGTLQEIKIEGIGFYAPSASTPMTFVDRNQAGFVVASHTGSGPGPWTAANPFHQTCDGEGISGYALFEPGPDGVTDTVNTIQGVRSYDPAMGTWTTPDAYAGDASDPMSRKSYMWNKNNPFLYSDPDGFCADPGPDGKVYATDPTCYVVRVHSKSSNNPGKPERAKSSKPSFFVLGFMSLLRLVGEHTYVRGEASDVLAFDATSNLCGRAYSGVGAAVGFPLIMNASAGAGLIFGDPKKVMSGKRFGVSVLLGSVNFNSSGVMAGISASPNVASLSLTSATPRFRGWCEK